MMAALVTISNSTWMLWSICPQELRARWTSKACVQPTASSGSSDHIPASVPSPSAKKMIELGLSRTWRRSSASPTATSWDAFLWPRRSQVSSPLLESTAVDRRLGLSWARDGAPLSDGSRMIPTWRHFLHSHQKRTVSTLRDWRCAGAGFGLDYAALYCGDMRWFW